MYDIQWLKEKESELKLTFKEHFETFFREFDYADLPAIKARRVNIRDHKDISKLLYKDGVYLILTDYMIDENPCELIIDNLKVIYRGHGSKVRKRVESHLFNKKYKLDKDGTNYTVCMKLNGDNGINLNEEPYCKFKWLVVSHSMPYSSKTMREQAEQAFDSIFNKPVGSYV
ncbi:hypothetical protein ACCF70_000689 [Vibrio parahaemolyticus]|nr:hypothetical protein [Vibrio parahaemolyticus]EJY0897405.1 hypothetical protein [Vibrio parahaemolyticus]ELA7345067.1 hypothetical protein [Vibrio parahaemolyticus]